MEKHKKWINLKMVFTILKRLFNSINILFCNNRNELTMQQFKI